MPNVLDHLFGGNVPAGLLTPSGIGQARRAGLLNAGIGMLSASQNQGFGGALASGLKAGQSGYDQSAATQVASAEQQRAAEAERRRQEIFAGLSPKPGESRDATRARMHTALMELLRLGDNEGARSISEVLKTMGDGAEAREPGTWMSVPGPDGKPMRRYVTASEAGKGGVPEYQAPPTPRTVNRRPVTVVNPATGKPEIANYDPSTGGFEMTGQRPGTAGAASEGERKAFALLQMVTPVAPILDAADAPSRIEMLSRERRLGEVLSAEQQQNDIAGRAIMDAYLRLTTGAAYNANEMNNTHVMLVPMPGDQPATLALKRRMRHSLMAALRTAAGRAMTAGYAGETTGAESLYPEPGPTWDDVIEGLP